MTETTTAASADLVGSELDLGIGLDPVSPTLLAYWCEAFQDSNPRYRGDDAVAPPALATAVCRLPYWPTDPELDQRGLIGVVGDALARPESVVQAVDFRVERDLRLGERVRCIEKVLSISEEKTTRIGVGNFVRLERRYVDLDGGTVSVAELDFLKYARSAPRSAVAAPAVDALPTRTTARERGGFVPARRDLTAEDLARSPRLAPSSVVLDGTRMVQMAYVSRDFNPVHHDVEYARANGLAGMFVQWACYIGMFDRYVGHEIGWRLPLRRVRFRMLRPVYGGKTAELSGEVEGVEDDGSGRIALRVADDAGITTEATLWVGA